MLCAAFSVYLLAHNKVEFHSFNDFFSFLVLHSTREKKHLQCPAFKIEKPIFTQAFWFFFINNVTSLESTDISLSESEVKLAVAW